MRLIDADTLLAEYDKIHVGEPGRARKLIAEQPTIEPHKWIPCSERLPETDMCRTLTTICTPYKGTNVRSGCFYRGLFMNDNGDTWNATDKEVLAWMPLPEPWRGGEDGNQTE